MAMLYDKPSGNPYRAIDPDEEELIEAESRARKPTEAAPQTEQRPDPAFVININLVLNVHLP